MNRILVSLSISICVVLSAFSTPAHGKRPFTIDDMTHLQNLVESQISPQGDRVAYVSTRINTETDRFEFTLRVADCETGEVAIVAAGPADYCPRWSPDGKQLAFLRAIGEYDSICVVDLEESTTRVLAQPRGSITNFNWAPDGHQLVLTAPYGCNQSPPAVCRSGFKSKKQRNQLFSVDSDSGQVEALPGVPGHVTGFSFSPGPLIRLAVSTQPTPAVDDHMEQDIYIVPLDLASPLGHLVRPVATTVASIPLVVRQGLDAAPEWSPDGRYVAYETTAGDSRVFAQSHIEVIEVSRSRSDTATEPRRYTVAGSHRMDWSGDSKHLLVTCESGVSWKLVKLTIQNGEQLSLSTAGTVCKSFSFSADRSRAAFHLDAPDCPPDVYVSSLEDFRAERVTNLNSQVSELDMPEATVMRWNSDDGRKIEGVLYKPAGLCGEMPLVVRLHGGPAGAFSLGFGPEGITSQQAEILPPQVLATHGYAVFCPNPRGSSGYGHEFVELAVGDWGDGPLQDVLSGIDHLINQGLVDERRIAIGGYCYGGYLTNYAISKSERFRCAMPFAGISNAVSHFGTTDVPTHSTDYFGGSPSVAARDYIAQSPVFTAASITTPLLMQHGEADERVAVLQSHEMAAALKYANVPHRIVTYPDEGHVMSRPSHLRSVVEENVAWLKRWMAAGDGNTPEAAESLAMEQ